MPAQLKHLRACNNSPAQLRCTGLATKINLFFSWASVAKLSEVGPKLAPVAIARLNVVVVVGRYDLYLGGVAVSGQSC